MSYPTSMIYQKPVSVATWHGRSTTTPEAKKQSYFVGSRIAWLFRAQGGGSRVREFVVGAFRECAEMYPVYTIQIPEVGEMHFALVLEEWIISCDFATPAEGNFVSRLEAACDVRGDVLTEQTEGLMPHYGPYATNKRRFTTTVREVVKGEHFEIYAFMFSLSRALRCPR